MKSARTFAVLALTILAATAASPIVFAQEVGGVQIQRTAGPYQILIAQNPSSVSVGRVTVAVAVIDASTGQRVPDATVIIRTRHRPTGREGWAHAVKYLSADRYDAELKLPEQGTWDIEVDIESPLGGVTVAGLPVNVPTSERLTAGSLVFVGVFVVLLAGVGYVWWSARRAQRRRALAAASEPRVEDDLEHGP